MRSHIKVLHVRWMSGKLDNREAAPLWPLQMGKHALLRTPDEIQLCPNLARNGHKQLNRMAVNSKPNKQNIGLQIHKCVWHKGLCFFFLYYYSNDYGMHIIAVINVLQSNLHWMQVAWTLYTKFRLSYKVLCLLYAKLLPYGGESK